MAGDVDSKDRAILAALRSNAKASIQELAALTHIPATTIHQRIKRLEREGIIRGYRAVIDDSRIGLGAKAIVFLKAAKGLPPQVHASEAVQEVRGMVGEYDYVVDIACATIEEIHMTLRYLKRIDGVDDVHAYMVLEHY